MKFSNCLILCSVSRASIHAFEVKSKIIYYRKDLRYILDPEDVCGPGCINETFRVLKDNEMRQLGEYRTKRLVLEAWNNFGFGN